MPPTYTKRVLMVISVADMDRARQAAAAFDNGRPGRTFSCPLSATGLTPATHYAASVQMRPKTAKAVADLVAKEFPAGTMREYDLDEPGAADAIFTSLGLKRIDGGLG